MRAESVLFPQLRSCASRRPKPPRRLLSIAPVSQRTLGSTAVVLALIVVLRSSRSAIICAWSVRASVTADRMSERRYKPNAAALTEQAQNRNRPSTVPTWPVAISQPATASAAMTIVRLNRNKKARSDITKALTTQTRNNGHGFFVKQKDQKGFRAANAAEEEPRVLLLKSLPDGRRRIS
jgi:hypothetical protein